MSDPDSDIVDAEIVEEGDDEIESLAERAQEAEDAAIDDAEVVDPADLVRGGQAEVSVADPEVISLLRDTTGPLPIVGAVVSEPAAEPEPDPMSRRSRRSRWGRRPTTSQLRSRPPPPAMTRRSMRPRPRT